MKNLMVISLEEARGIAVENVAGTILETEKFYPDERRPKTYISLNGLLKDICVITEQGNLIIDIILINNINKKRFSLRS